MYKKIVLAYDGSDSAKAALRHARDVAQSCGSKVYVVNAYPIIPKLEGYEWVQQAIAAGTARGQELVDEAAAELRKAGIEVSTEVLEGPPAQAIAEVAETRNADLIVMGNRGYNVFAEVFLGSVSLQVLTHCKIPVLIVKTE